jgi:SAM-dependent methyltransferase
LQAGSTDQRALDVGGGEGYLSEALFARGYSVTCLAKPGTATGQLPAGIRVVEVDLDDDLPDLGEFEVVVCGDVIEHVRDPDRLLQWLNNLLKGGGKLVASLPNSGHLYFRLTVLLGHFPSHDRGLFDRTHLHFYSWSGWTQLFDQNGFSIEAVEPTSIPLGLALGWDEGNPVVRVGETVNYVLARVWKTMLAYQFVVLATPKSTGT